MSAAIASGLERQVSRPAPDQVTAPARFVFVLCPERSGSTMLSAMLGGHPRVIAPPELHLLRFDTVGEWRQRYPAAEVSLEVLMEATGFGGEPIADTSTPLSLYRKLQSRAQNGVYLVDKTPAYARRNESLRAAEALDPLYVWLVRHPLGVAASRINRDWSRRPTENVRWAPWLKYPLWRIREGWRRWSGESARTLSEDWAEVHGRLRWFLRGVDPSRVIRVHYEDLVREPRIELARLCHFLGVNPEPAMLDPRGNAPKGLRWGLGDEKLLQHAGIDPHQADAWRAELSEDLLSPRVREMAMELGVRLDDAAGERARPGVDRSLPLPLPG
jgi:LPS sulfotransferase NodH